MKIFVEVKGGCVNAVYCARPANVVIVDYDNVTDDDLEALKAEAELNAFLAWGDVKRVY